ncbi:hypothetical protein XI25_26690 [Paenibacillus sp. DMB20]|nr:hypothetical protein XI25_26690 [Paenibacillus sp. DMB20]
MSSEPTNPLDWLNQDPFFKKHFPFKTLEDQWRLDPNQVDSYVQNIINQATTSGFMDGVSSLRYEHFDMHDTLVTMIRIPKRIHPESIWVQLSRTQIKVNGLKDKESELIKLPVPVNPDRTKATYKQGSLQLRMPKLSSGRFKDVFIRYL